MAGSILERLRFFGGWMNGMRPLMSMNITIMILLGVLLSEQVAGDRVEFEVVDIGKTGCNLVDDCTLHKDGADRMLTYGMPRDSWKSNKHCYCRFSYNAEYDDCRVFKVTSSIGKFSGSYVMSSQPPSEQHWVRIKTGYNEPSIVFWKNSGDGCWYAAATQVGVWDTSDSVKCCGHEQDFSGCDGEQLAVTECKKLTRSDGQCAMWSDQGTSTSDGFPNSAALCHHKESCSPFGWCGGGTDYAYCKDSCMTPSLFFGDCNLDELTTPVDFCDISPLDHVTASLTASDYLDIAGSLVGEIPYVGSVFDQMFTVFGALTGAQSTADLANDIIDGVNQQVESLQKCIYQEISQLSAEMMSRDYKAIMIEMQACSAYTGEDKKTCISNVFLEMYGRINADFGPSTNADVPFLDYENKLPVFQAAKSLWMTILSGQLEVQQSTNDSCNFNADLTMGVATTDFLLKWPQYAVDAIVKELTSPLVDSTTDNRACENYETSQGWEFYRWSNAREWGRAWAPKNRRDISRCGKKRFEQQVKIEIQMTKFSAKKCTVHRRGDWVCGTGALCDEIDRVKQYIAGRVVDRLTADLIPQFNKKFVDDLATFSASLKRVPEMTCNAASRNTARRSGRKSEV